MNVKEQLRKALKEKRKNLSSVEADEKSRLVTEIFLKNDAYKNASTIMLYMPIQNEVDTGRIISKALEDGKKLVFPVTERESGNITPYFASCETEFVKGNFSVPEPICARPAKAEDIDVIIVPGIGFDSQGNRIGFGKGCYDSFLCKCDALKIGVCYGFQLLEKIPADAHDIKMDYVLTETEFRKTRD